MKNARISVIGVGNVLMGDDAFGPHVIKVLEAFYYIEPEVELIEAGTPGLGLADILNGLEIAYIFDAVRAEGAPGTVKLFTTQDLLKPLQTTPVSPHDPGLLEALQLLQISGGVPAELFLISVIPASYEGPGLSPAIKDSIEKAISVLADELSKLGVKITKRTIPGKPDLWWE
jgi:hydrogenase maturation protease